jgi:hypothetical protein
MIDKNYRIVTANPRFQRLVGIADTGEAAPGLFDFAKAPFDDAKVRKCIQLVATKGGAQMVRVAFERERGTQMLYATRLNLDDQKLVLLGFDRTSGPP